jgi:hypothetical protein
VYLEGTVRRYAPLARDVHGPRAILNAIERLRGTYEADRDQTARDLAITQGQLRDYDTRLGAGFAHTAYLEELTGLRHQLEAALSSTAPEGADASLPTVGAIVERLKALKAAHTLDATPQRSAPRSTATVEEAITTRIRQREHAEAAPQPEAALPPVSPATPTPPGENAPDRPASRAQGEGARQSPATPLQDHTARPEPWLPPRQLRLF